MHGSTGTTWGSHLPPVGHYLTAERRVFIAEGSPLLLLALERFLNSHDIEVAAKAVTADEAMAHARSVDADFAMIDQRLLGDGITPLLAILGERGMPALLSGPYGAPPPARCSALALVRKPYSSDELIAAIRKLLPVAAPFESPRVDPGPGDRLSLGRAAPAS